jgi:hypothetical protein
MGSQFYFSLLLSLDFFLFPFSLSQKMVYVAEDGLQVHNNKMILDIKMKGEITLYSSEVSTDLHF